MSGSAQTSASLTRSSRRGLTAAAAALSLLLGAGRAQAQGSGDVEAYQSALQKADALWAAKKYPQARAEYELAYQIHPEPILLFNIASTYRREGNHKKALSFYERFLEVAPQDEPRRALAEETVVHLRDTLREMEKNPQAPPPDETAPRFITPPPPPDDGDEGGGGGGNVLIWSGVGAGAIGVGALAYGLFQGARAMDLEKDFEGLMPGESWTPEYIALYEKGEGYERRAIIFSIVGGAALATGATLFYLGWRQRGDDGSERAVSFLPYAGDNEAGMAVLGHF